MKASPACKLVTETTADSSGETLRAVMVCKRCDHLRGCDDRIDRQIRESGMPSFTSDPHGKFVRCSHHGTRYDAQPTERLIIP